MKILLIYVPSRRQEIIIPFGLLYLASSVKEEGNDVRIIDLCLDKISDEELMSEIDIYQPDVVGFGAITPGYQNLIRITLKIRSRFPDILLIAGGIIASVSRLLITKADIDVVVLKEGETVIKNVLKVISENSSFCNVRGIAYKGEGGSYNENAHEVQISNMDDIPIPPYSLINVRRYCSSVDGYMDEFNWNGILTKSEIDLIKSKSDYLIPIVTSRGCTHQCSFCYRHMKGVRQFSPGYVIKQIKYLQREYQIHFFQFNDELTNVTKKWCHDFCDLLDSENMNITYVINGARVSNVDEYLLRRFKETGCVGIGFGYESGSQKILEYVNKGVSKEENYEVGRLLKKVGLNDAAQIVIGFPPESPETIDETIKFLKSLAPIRPSVNYILPFPGTRDWDYCLKNGLIKNEEEFILAYDEASTFRINLTQYSEEEVKCWQFDINSALYLVNLKKDRKYFKYIMLRISLSLGSRYFRSKFLKFAKSYRVLNYMKELIQKAIIAH